MSGCVPADLRTGSDFPAGKAFRTDQLKAVTGCRVLRTGRNFPARSCLRTASRGKYLEQIVFFQLDLNWEAYVLEETSAMILNRSINF